MFYQPQIDFESNQIIGVEALLRWQQSKGTYVSPIEFITTAEKSGLIVPIGEWVITEACKQAAKLKSIFSKPIRMAVNVSTRQFNQKNFVDFILLALESSGTEPSQFEVEITESLLIEDIENAMSVLSRLRSAGISIALDDFGTGYSSLSYLDKYPVNRIKIDKTFIKNINDHEGAVLAKVIINMAKSLDIPAIAEGIETAQQYEFIKDTGCKEGQGYYIGKPMPFKELLNFLQNMVRQR